MEIKLSKIDNQHYEVFSPTVRNESWILIRKNGTGTYASIAGKGHYDDDQDIVVEEFSDPDNRKIWDSLTVKKCVETVYTDIINDILIKPLFRS